MEIPPLVIPITYSFTTPFCFEKEKNSPRHPASGRSDPFKNPLLPLADTPNLAHPAPPPPPWWVAYQPDHPHEISASPKVRGFGSTRQGASRETPGMAWKRLETPSHAWMKLSNLYRPLISTLAYNTYYVLFMGFAFWIHLIGICRGL